LGAYLVRRVGLMLVTLFGISVVIFLMLRVAPGNFADVLLADAGYDDRTEKLKIERECGLDQPLVGQYAGWIGGLLRGDLGHSCIHKRPVAAAILRRIPVTASLAGLSLALSVLLGVPLGVLSAVRQDTLLDYGVRVLALSGLSIPQFWLGQLVLMAAVAWFKTIPIYSGTPHGFWAALTTYAVAAAVVGFSSSAFLMRLTRSSMLEVLGQDYIRTARAKGASEGAVNLRHALKNAVLPLVTIIGFQAANLMGGLVVVEKVFNIPGVATFLLDAVVRRDYPIVQNLAMYIAVIVVTVNFLVDMLYTVLDPRIKYSG
jgi:peptide/nickel transport system permease protein